MAHLIDKDALVAEIERLAEVGRTNANVFDESRKEKAVWLQQADVCDRILSLIDTLEVKEVDLKKEIQAFALLELEPLKIYDANVGISITMHQLYQCSKHFFELGLKAKQE